LRRLIRQRLATVEAGIHNGYARWPETERLASGEVK